MISESRTRQELRASTRKDYCTATGLIHRPVQGSFEGGAEEPKNNDELMSQVDVALVTELESIT